MTGHRETSETSGIVHVVMDREPVTAKDLAAGGEVVRSVATKLLSPLLAGRPGENVAFSPLSIVLALGMLRAGAQGDSAAELDALFGLDGSALPAALNAVDLRLSELDGGDSAPRHGFDGNVHLASANALWGQQGITWLEPFLAVLAADYGTGMRTVDYRGDPERCRELINTWVAEQTRQKIPELLVPGSVTDDHVLALTNALWFKAAWRHTFLRIADGPFTSGPGRTVDVPRMAVSSQRLRYGRGADWQTVQIPYVGGQIAMTLVLPDAGSDASVAGLLSSADGLRALVQPSEDRTVNLTMPLFDLDTATELGDVLSAIGVVSPFVEMSPDFAPMTADEVVWVERVAHQATVTVDEHGTEAAAATAVMMVRASASIPVDPITVVVDRPFYFAISLTDDVLPFFLGRVTDPTVK